LPVQASHNVVRVYHDEEEAFKVVAGFNGKRQTRIEAYVTGLGTNKRM